MLALCSVFQRYNLKAIHNSLQDTIKEAKAVLGISKIQSESNSQLHKGGSAKRNGCARYFKDTIWKQFTTYWGWICQYCPLCSVFQRYNLKAIHNTISNVCILVNAVLGISKIQSESNSQPLMISKEIPISCARYFKDTIWKQFTTIQVHHSFTVVLCSVFQRYNLKAIHNERFIAAVLINAVLGISKIQSESNSQL